MQTFDWLLKQPWSIPNRPWSKKKTKQDGGAENVFYKCFVKHASRKDLKTCKSKLSESFLSFNFNV